MVSYCQMVKPSINATKEAIRLVKDASVYRPMLRTKYPATFLIPSSLQAELRTKAEALKYRSFSLFVETILKARLDKLPVGSIWQRSISEETAPLNITLSPEVKESIEKRVAEEREDLLTAAMRALKKVDASKRVVTRKLIEELLPQGKDKVRMWRAEGASAARVQEAMLEWSDILRRCHSSKVVAVVLEDFLAFPEPLPSPESKLLVDRLKPKSASTSRIAFMARQDDWDRLLTIAVTELGFDVQSREAPSEALRAIIGKFSDNPWPLFDPALLALKKSPKHPEGLKQPEFLRTVILEPAPLATVLKLAKTHGWTTAAALRTLLRSYFDGGPGAGVPPTPKPPKKGK